MSKHAEELKALKALRGSLETLRNLSERISIDIETAVENRSYITEKVNGIATISDELAGEAEITEEDEYEGYETNEEQKQGEEGVEENEQRRQSKPNQEQETDMTRRRSLSSFSSDSD